MSVKTTESNAKDEERRFFDAVYVFYSYEDSFLLRLRLKLMALFR